MDVKKEVLSFLESQNSIPGQSEVEKLGCAYLDVGVIDSLGIVTMIGNFEEKFRIRFTSEDLQSPDFQTVRGLIGIIERLMKEGSTGH